MISPRRNHIYTLAQVLTELDLQDSPNLSFVVADDDGNDCEPALQTSHVKSEELLLIEGFAESRWVYHYTTHEWIPVFTFAKDNARPITDFIDMEKEIDPYDSPNRNGMWCTPKGHPREQYYMQDEHGAYRVRDTGKLYNEF